MQTVVIDCRQANDKHDGSMPSSLKVGSESHYEAHDFRNCELFGEEESLRTFNVDDLDPCYSTIKYGEHQAQDPGGDHQLIDGCKNTEQLVSNLPDHSVPAQIR